MADATRRSTRFSMRSKQLGQLLLEQGDVQAEQVAGALKTQEQQGGMLGQILRAEGICNDGQIAQALLKQVQVTDVQCDELGVPPEVASLIPREVCEAEKLCPFERLGSLLCIVMGNPLNRRAITQIEERTHLKVKSFKSVWPKIQQMIDRTYGQEPAPVEGEADAVIAAPEMPGAQPPMEIATEGEAGLQLDDFPPTQQAAPSPAGSAARRMAEIQAAAAAAEPRVQGIDNLNEASAEVIETTRRGLKRQQPASAPAIVPPPKPKPEKKAKINVDLDKLDLSQGEVIRDAMDDETLEEISHLAATQNKMLQRHAGEIVPLKLVRDGYFYDDGKSPSKRSDALLDLIDHLPVAEVIAQSIGEYEDLKAKTEPGPKPPADRPVLKMAAAAALIGAKSPASVAHRPIELQPAPAVVVAALLISESDFQRATGALTEDPVGEWDWRFAAAGPVAVMEYEEN